MNIFWRRMRWQRPSLHLSSCIPIPKTSPTTMVLAITPRVELWYDPSSLHLSRLSTATTTTPLSMSPDSLKRDMQATQMDDRALRQRTDSRRLHPEQPTRRCCSRLAMLKRQPQRLVFSYSDGRRWDSHCTALWRRNTARANIYA